MRGIALVPINGHAHYHPHASVHHHPLGGQSRKRTFARGATLCRGPGGGPSAGVLEISSVLGILSMRQQRLASETALRRLSCRKWMFRCSGNTPCSQWAWQHLRPVTRRSKADHIQLVGPMAQYAEQFGGAPEISERTDEHHPRHLCFG